MPSSHVLPGIAAAGFFLSCLLVFAGAAHALYFYTKYQRDLDRYLMGERYFDGGFLYAWFQRMALYAGAVVVPHFARRIPLIDPERLRKISPTIKRHLIWHFWGFVVALVMAVVSGSFVYAYSECWIGQDIFSFCDDAGSI